MKKIILAFALFHSAIGFGQAPTMLDILQKMERSISEIKTLRYLSNTTTLNSGRQDSVYQYSAECWLEMKPADTVFGAFVHVKQRFGNQSSEYYYDGIHGVDIWHHSSDPNLSKTITVIEPYVLSNGSNQAQNLVSLIPYVDEVIGKGRVAHWKNTADAWKVSRGVDAWTLEYSKTGSIEQHVQLIVDRKTMLLREFHEVVRFNGVTFKTDKVISEVVMNDPGTLVHVTLQESFPEYKRSYQERDVIGGKKEPSRFVGMKAKDFKASTFEGKSTSLEALRGKLTLIDFWESWCSYCIMAMPGLNDLYKRYHERGLNIIGVVTENQEKVQQIVLKQKIRYPNVYAKKEVLEQYRVHARPRYLLINEAGTIVADDNLDKIITEIETYFKTH
jgi:peroxiredoxin